MKTMKHFLLLLASVALLGLASCDDYLVRGNGISGSESRYTFSFDEVKSSGQFIVHISEGDDYEVLVNAETNLLYYIDTHVHGNSLHIDIRGLHSVRNRLPMEVFITTPYLDGIKQSGSGSITTDYFYANDFDISISGSGRVETAVECDELDVRVSGSGRVIISGQADLADMSISGSGKIDACDLDARDCYAKISGSGDICVYVERLLVGTISGSGNIFYRGNPTVESHISGSGKIIPD